MVVIGNEILEFETVASTNDIAWQFHGDLSRHGLVVQANYQSAGRGQRGNRWVAPPNSCLMMSILLHHHSGFAESYQYTLWAALSICHLVHELTGREPHLKWPNDMLMDGKKLSGILVERRGDWIVVGIGLNIAISEQEFLQAQLKAISLNHYLQHPLTPKSVLPKALAILDANYQLITQGHWQTMQSAWQHYSQLMNHHVELQSSGRKFVGHLFSLEWNKIVLLIDGKYASFHPGSVTSIRLL